MQRLARWFLYLIAALIVLVCVGVIYLYFATTNSRSGQVAVSGLQGKVIIRWDQYGVPHITALQSDADAFFALGYVHAQDRFWQMELDRRIVQGTLSEILGSSALPQDEFLRTWGFYRAAQQTWMALDPQTKALVHSYTQGVNAFLAHGHLPLQFKMLRYQPKPWTDIDSIAWGKMMAFDLQNAWQQKITDYQVAQRLGENQIAVLAPNYPQGAPTILTANNLRQNGLLAKSIAASSSINVAAQQLDKQFELIKADIEKQRALLGFNDLPGKGSNNWVVSGKYTKSGKPLLANDPHLALSAPAVWYLAELKGPTLHVIGATLPGIPGVIIGHNDHIAWGVTNVNPDTQELYIEPANKQFLEIKEIIKVKGKPAVIWPVHLSDNGPVINSVTPVGKITQPIVLKWTALLPGDTTPASIFKLNYAQNWQQFTDALRYFTVPSQNFVYADTQGNIGYYLSGKIPIRVGWNGGLPVPDDAQHQWSGFIPFEKLPHVLNPPQGFIASANNRVVPDVYPYQLTFRWKEPPYRIERIEDLLKERTSLSVADMVDIQQDVVSYLWRDLRPVLIKTKPRDALSRQALQLLQAWNGVTDRHSVAATIFAYWYRELTQMPVKQLGFVQQWREPLFIKQQLVSNGVYCRDQNASCQDYLSQTLQTVVQKLAATLGSNPQVWNWSKIHRALFDAPALGKSKAIGWIWQRQIDTAGGLYTVDVGTYGTDSYYQIDGPSYRQIVDLSNLDHSLYQQTLGQSGNVGDKHYDDLMSMWRNGIYLPMSSDEAKWGKVQTFILTP